MNEYDFDATEYVVYSCEPDKYDQGSLEQSAINFPTGVIFMEKTKSGPKAKMREITVFIPGTWWNPVTKLFVKIDE